MSKELRNLFLEFSYSAKPIRKLMDDIDAEVSQALRSAEVRGKHEAVRSASMVLLSGFLESFLKNCAEAFFSAIRRRGVRYSQLPSSMHEVHFIAGIEVVQRIAKDEKKSKNVGFHLTQQSLREIMRPPADDLSGLFWKAFAVTKGNPGPDVIAEYLKNFGVTSPLEEVGLVTGQSVALIRSTLQSFIAIRNECAHTGRSGALPTPSEVRDFVYFLRTLTLGVTKLLERRIVALGAGAPAVA